MTRKFKLKPPEERASRNINIRVTEATHTDIELRANSHNLSISEYVLRTALGRPINKSTTFKIGIELLAIANLIREVHKTDKCNEQKYREILQAVADTIIAIPMRITNRQPD